MRRITRWDQTVTRSPSDPPETRSFGGGGKTTPERSPAVAGMKWQPETLTLHLQRAGGLELNEICGRKNLPCCMQLHQVDRMRVHQKTRSTSSLPPTASPCNRSPIPRQCCNRWEGSPTCGCRFCQITAANGSRAPNWGSGSQCSAALQQCRAVRWFPPPPAAAAAAAVETMSGFEGMEKITFGDNLPGYVCGSVTDPAVIVIQMSLCQWRAVAAADPALHRSCRPARPPEVVLPPSSPDAARLPAPIALCCTSGGASSPW